MSSLNKVTLIGHLGKDPQVVTSQEGQKIIKLSIATSESWKDKQTGERQSKSEWHRVVIFQDRLVDVCEKYLKKGSRVFVEGQLKTKKWTGKDGRENYTPEIVVSNYKGDLLMLDRREDTSPSNGNSYQPSYNTPQSFEDDLPF